MNNIFLTKVTLAGGAGHIILNIGVKYLNLVNFRLAYLIIEKHIG